MFDMTDARTGLGPVLWVGALGSSSFFTLIALGPALAAEEGGDVTAGSITTVFMIATVATQIAMSRLLRVATPASLLRWSVLLLGLPALTYLLPINAYIALSVAALRGIGFGIITIATTALVAIYSSTSEQGRSLGIYGFVTSAAGVIFPTFSMIMYEQGRVFIPVLLAVALPCAALFRIGSIAAASSEPILSETRASPRLWATCTRVDIVWPVLIFLPSAVAYGGLYTFLPMSSRTPIVALLVFGAGFAVGRYSGGWLSDRRRPSVVIVWSSLLALFGVVATALVGDGLIGMAFPLVAGLGIGATATASLIWVMASVGLPKAGLGSTIWNMSFDIGIAIGGIGLGIIASKLDYAWAYGSTAMLMIFSSALALAVALRRRSGKHIEP